MAIPKCNKEGWDLEYQEYVAYRQAIRDQYKEGICGKPDPEDILGSDDKWNIK